MAQQSTEIDRELRALEAELKRLESEYNMYFAGRLPRPPWETRRHVESMVRRLDRTHLSNYGDRFRFSTLQSRLTKFTTLWDRGLRAREEGRPGPFSAPRSSEPRPKKVEDHVLLVTSFKDPTQEAAKLRDLYDSLAEARRETGEDKIPFNKFAELVKTQVAQLRKRGTAEVAFRVAVKGGKVAFTARVSKGDK
jgi:hypothetical protein